MQKINKLVFLLIASFMMLNPGLARTHSSLDLDTSVRISAAFEFAQKQYNLMYNSYTDLTKYPRSADGNGNTSFTDIRDWTGGFWPGNLWYLFEYTGNDYWRDAALKWTKSLEKNQYNTNHHDIGFVMNCSYGNAYRLTGDTTFKSIIIQSAKSLLTRFDPKVGVIKSWNIFPSWDGKNKYDYPVIIDNMMNLELLFLASKLSGDDKYKKVAIAHAEKTLLHQYRPDYSSYHVINYDPNTGEVLSKETAQGFSDNSAWARGQAWGLYGFVVMYRETKNPKYLHAACKMADFYRNHPGLPHDKIPLWDFDVNQPGYIPNWDYRPQDFKEIPRDASAAAVTASALLELATYIEGKDSQAYIQLSEDILTSLGTSNYTSELGKNGFFLLKHSVGSIPHKGEIDVPLVYADYYYLEALMRLKKLYHSSANIREQWRQMNASKTKALDEFQQHKFGMFIHWGPYAIPGGIWEGKKMEEMGSPSVAEWIQLVAKIPRDEYEKLSLGFNPKSFDADRIARIAKDAGMKYIVITSKHHDGFAMFDSKVSDFNVVHGTPFKRDIIGELAAACKRHELDFGVYYSQNIDWKDGSDAQYAITKAINDQYGLKTSSFGANLWDPSSNSFASYMNTKAIPQIKELLQQYPSIKYIWFDMPELMTAQQSYQFYKTVFELNPNVIVSERLGNNMGDYLIPGDNRIPLQTDQLNKPWEAIGTFNHSWGYKSYDKDWKSIDELKYWILEIVSKGGNYMLNIGPDAHGDIDAKVENNLKKIGQWMKTNKEAIYGTKPYRVNHEGPTSIQITDTEQREREGFKANFTDQDFWFTQKGSAIYVISLVAPSENQVKINALKLGHETIKSVSLLNGSSLPFKQEPDNLVIDIPRKIKIGDLGYVLKIEKM